MGCANACVEHADGRSVCCRTRDASGEIVNPVMLGDFMVFAALEKRRDGTGCTTDFCDHVTDARGECGQVGNRSVDEDYCRVGKDETVGVNIEPGVALKVGDAVGIAWRFALRLANPKPPPA